jgi:hypothetical protein
MGSMTLVRVDRTTTVEEAAVAWGSCGADRIGIFVGANVAADPRNAETIKGIATRVGEVGAHGRCPPAGQVTVIKFRPGANLRLEAKDYAVSHQAGEDAADEDALAIVLGPAIFERLALVDVVSRGQAANANPRHATRASDQDRPGRISLLDAAEAALE